jgi:transcription elongation factor Elf1
MTFERRCLCSPDDIIAIQYVCANCGAAIVVPADKISGEKARDIAMGSCSDCKKSYGFKIKSEAIDVFSDFHDRLGRFFWRYMVTILNCASR